MANKLIRKPYKLRNKCIFQHDVAAVHTVKAAEQYFTNKKNCTLEWLAKSPELNIVDNCWGNLARVVYQEDNSQILMNLKYEYRGKVGKTKLKCHLKTIYKSLPQRMAAIVKCKGHTKY